jgi:hypothetical protein
MKNKLRKDLKFLRSWIARLVMSLGIAGILVTAAQTISFESRGYAVTIYFIVSIIASYIALYFFNAWLVGDEEDSDKEET